MLQMSVISRVGQEQRSLGVAAPGCGGRYAARQRHGRDHVAGSAERARVDDQEPVCFLREGFGESFLDVVPLRAKGA